MRGKLFQTVIAPKHNVYGTSSPPLLYRVTWSCFHVNPENLCHEASKYPCKRTNKLVRDSMYGVEMQGSTWKIDVRLISFWSPLICLMQVSEGGNNAACLLQIAVHSDMVKTDNVGYGLCVAIQSTYGEGRDMHCDPCDGKNDDKNNRRHKGSASCISRHSAGHTTLWHRNRLNIGTSEVCRAWFEASHRSHTQDEPVLGAVVL